jgi:hypothetical protein
MSARRWTAPTWSSLRPVGFEVIIRQTNFIYLLVAHRAEDCLQEIRGRALLPRTHFLQADAPTRNDSGWEVGPAFPLLIIVKCEEHCFSLLRIEHRQKAIRGIHDVSRLASVLGDRRFERETKSRSANERYFDPNRIHCPPVNNQA